ncbi:MAG TPA: VacJ family lipoprotein, partial [Geminicoccaceae bacterium]|nr:VacJ family lipoprotein [Geminicoccaceae bacterium]
RSPRGPLATAAVAGLLLAAGLALAALPMPAAAQADDVNDPIEPVNRAVFRFNQQIDGMFIEPAAILYRLIVPQPVRTGVGNVLLNLFTPVTLANDLLQGKFDRAGVTLGRFAVNSTVGILGLVDVGSRIGLAYHFEDFGQTLGHYGVGEGPYLMVPLLGPSNPRDLSGRVVDLFLDPMTYIAPTEARVGRTAADAVTLREQNLESLNTLERTSLDFYAAVRNSFRQYRAAEIRNGGAPITEGIYDDIYDFDDDPFEDPARGGLDDPAAGER